MRGDKTLKELLFNIDNFNKQKTVDGAKGQGLLLHHSLMGRRDGTHISDQLAFEISRFRFDDMATSANQIATQLKDHCNKYLKGIYIDDISIKLKTQRSFNLFINIADSKTSNTGVIIFSVEKKDTEVLVNLL